jgi:hypothetical protein
MRFPAAGDSQAALLFTPLLNSDDKSDAILIAMTAHKMCKAA